MLIKYVKYFFLSLFFLLSFLISAQNNLNGVVYEKLQNGDKKPLSGVNIYWKDFPESGSISKDNGNYSILEPFSYPSELVFSYVGYKTTIMNILDSSFLEVYLSNSVQLQNIEIVGTKSSTSFSPNSPLNIQTLSASELEKAACCNLSESFSTNATVDIHFSDAVTGAKKIEMLGLDGIYTQITQENMPLIQGLSSSFGLTYVPGTWIESIQIIKGSGSVVNGHESLTGQINLEYYSPASSPKIFWNGYVNSHSKLENNVIYTKNKGRWKSNLFTHISYCDSEVDENDDGFLDIPKQTQFNFLNRWKYKSPNYNIDIKARALVDQRIGGTKSDFSPSYLVDISNKLIELSTKTGSLQKDTPGRSFGLQTLFRRHHQSAILGINEYNSSQERAYLNFIREDYLFTTDHNLIYGISHSTDRFIESLSGNIIDSLNEHNSTYSITGFFSEYSLKSIKDLNIVAGIRSDFYHQSQKNYVLPRINIKYNINLSSMIRLSAGRALRFPSVLSENLTYLASNRLVTINNLSPELAWNYGFNFSYCFNLFSREATLNTDFYRSLFENKIIVDIEEQSKISFYNLQGSSYSNSFQFDLFYDISKFFDIRLSYKFNDVKSTYGGVHKIVPLIAKEKGLLNLEYSTYFDKVIIDFTSSYTGKTRIPQHESIEECYSTPYLTFNSQITRRFKLFDIYLGVENISNYKQKDPILASNDPNSSLFDTALIYAPISGRMGYFGFRFKLK